MPYTYISIYIFDAVTKSDELKKREVREVKEIIYGYFSIFLVTY